MTDAPVATTETATSPSLQNSMSLSVILGQEGGGRVMGHCPDLLNETPQTLQIGLR